MPLDVGIDEQGVLDRFESGPCLLTYLNPLAWSVAEKNQEFVPNLTRFDLVVCDGIGVQMAVRAVYGCSSPIITLDFSGIAESYLSLAAKKRLALSLVGANTEKVEAAADVLRGRYPALPRIDAYSGFGDDPARARKAILGDTSGMVLIGMGMGRQESYLLDLADSGWRGIGICVGGFFDKLADPALDYPEWSKRIGLRFLGRLVKEPRRLSRRYFVEYQPFMNHYIKHIIHGNSR